MKQIYDFERYMPPAINENMLREELKRREKRRQTLLLALAAILLQAVLVLVGIRLFAVSPVLGAACLCYVIVSAVGSGVITIIFAQKGGLRHE